MMSKWARDTTCRTADWTFLAHPAKESLAESDRTMVGLLSLVSVREAIAYRVILCGQDPRVCSGFGRAEKRWTTSTCLSPH